MPPDDKPTWGGARPRSGPAPQPTGRRVLVQFRIRRDLATVLEAAAAEAGISIHQLARDVVEGVTEAGHLTDYTKPEDYE